MRYSEITNNLGIPEDKLKESLRKLNRTFARNLPKSSSNDSPEEKDLDENRGFLILYSNSVKARHYVGFARAGNFVVQVLPKVFEPSENEEKNADTNDALLAFLRMLNVAYGLKIREVELAQLREKRTPESLLEIFIYLFASTLWSEVQRGYHKEYIEIQNEERFLKGKLLMSKELRKLPHQRHTFSLEMHEFSEDNLLNQIFYAAVRTSLARTTWRVNKKLLGELMMIFDEVSFKEITKTDLERVHFTRLNERFKRAFTLAKIVLSTLGGIQGEEASGFFIDMNDLFERFMLWVLKRSLWEYEVEYQKELKLLKNGNILSRKQYPDFIINRNGTPVAVLDAKYKSLGTSEGKLQVSPDSLRQVYVYAKILEEKYGVSGIPVVLIFPKSNAYNSSIKTEDNEATVGGATFFDGRRLLVLVYDMETLKEGLKIDEKFRKSLCNLLGPRSNLDASEK
ncbi:McrC family protein [Pyrococcus yayanosii]|nr:restriction endonuclease [Pyrococcus yayanosii]